MGDTQKSTLILAQAYHSLRKILLIGFCQSEWLALRINAWLKKGAGDKDKALLIGDKIVIL